ncbi:hypothetical protein ACFL0Q_07920 [Thermodesulfobacteriota bacterium]
MENQRVSSLVGFWSYLRTKSRNAYWMLKTKGFKVFWDNLIKELNSWKTRYSQQAQVQVVVQHEEEVPFVDSAYPNKRKIIPPSARPTQTKILPLSPLKANTVTLQEELKNIIETLTLPAGKSHEEH